MELHPLPLAVSLKKSDPIDAVLAQLSPFDRSVVHLRYRANENLRGIAEALASTPEQVAVALMGVYRLTAAAVEA